jgi:hypothetical protein
MSLQELQDAYSKVSTQTLLIENNQIKLKWSCDCSAIIYTKDSKFYIQLNQTLLNYRLLSPNVLVKHYDEQGIKICDNINNTVDSISSLSYINGWLNRVYNS